MTNNENEYYYNLPLASFTFKANEKKENDNFEIFDNNNFNGLDNLNSKENQNNEINNNNNSFDFSNNIESNDSYIKVIIILLYKLREIREFINNNNNKSNEIIEILKEIFDNINNNNNIDINKLKNYLNSSFSNRRKFLYNKNDDPCDLFFIIINSFHNMNENDNNNNLTCDLKNNLCLFHKNFWIDLKKNTQFESGSRNEFYFSYNHFIFEMNIDKILNLIKNINNKDKILGKIFLYEKILFENNNENNNNFNSYSNRIVKNLFLLNEPKYFCMNVFSKNIINNKFTDNLKLFLMFPKIFNINSFFLCDKKINYKFYGIILIKNLNSFVILIKIKNLFFLFDEYYKIKFKNYFDFLTYSIKNNLKLYLFLYKKTKKIINNNNNNYENFEDVSSENILRLEKWIENNNKIENFLDNKIRNEENILNTINNNIKNNNNSFLNKNNSYFPKNKLNKIEKNNNTQHINSLSNLSSFNNNNINIDNTQDTFLNNAYNNHINKSLSNELNYSNKTKITKANSFYKQKLNKQFKQKIPNNYNKFLKSPEKKSLSGRNLKRYSKSNLNDLQFNNNNNNNDNNIINKSIDIKYNKIDYLNKNYDLPRPFIKNFEKKDNKSNLYSPNKQNIKINKSSSNFVLNSKNNNNNQNKNNNNNNNKNQKVLSLNAIRKFNTNLHKRKESNKNVKNIQKFWICPNCKNNNLIQNYRCKNCRFTIKNFESYSKLYLSNYNNYK